MKRNVERDSDTAFQLHSVKAILNLAGGNGAEVSTTFSTIYGACFLRSNGSLEYERYSLLGVHDRNRDSLAVGVVAVCCVENDWYCYILGLTAKGALICWVYREGSCLVDGREICHIPVEISSPGGPRGNHEFSQGSVFMCADAEHGILAVIAPNLTVHVVTIDFLDIASVRARARSNDHPLHLGIDTELVPADKTVDPWLDPSASSYSSSSNAPATEDGKEANNSSSKMSRQLLGQTGLQKGESGGGGPTTGGGIAGSNPTSRINQCRIWGLPAEDKAAILVAIGEGSWLHTWTLIREHHSSSSSGGFWKFHKCHQSAYNDSPSKPAVATAVAVATVPDDGNEHDRVDEIISDMHNNHISGVSAAGADEETSSSVTAMETAAAARARVTSVAITASDAETQEEGEEETGGEGHEQRNISTGNGASNVAVAETAIETTTTITIGDEHCLATSAESQAEMTSYHLIEVSHSSWITSLSSIRAKSTADAKAAYVASVSSNHLGEQAPVDYKHYRQERRNTRTLFASGDATGTIILWRIGYETNSNYTANNATAAARTSSSSAYYDVGISTALSTTSSISLEVVCTVESLVASHHLDHEYDRTTTATAGEKEGAGKTRMLNSAAGRGGRQQHSKRTSSSCYPITAILMDHNESLLWAADTTGTIVCARIEVIDADGQRSAANRGFQTAADMTATISTTATASSVAADDMNIQTSHTSNTQEAAASPSSVVDMGNDQLSTAASNNNIRTSSSTFGNDRSGVVRIIKLRRIVLDSVGWPSSLLWIPVNKHPSFNLQANKHPGATTGVLRAGSSHHIISECKLTDATRVVFRAWPEIAPLSAGHCSLIEACGVLSELDIIVTGGADAVLHCWNLRTGQRLCGIDTPDGYVKSIAVFSSDSAALQRVLRRRKERLQLQQHQEEQQQQQQQREHGMSPPAPAGTTSLFSVNQESLQEHSADASSRRLESRAFGESFYDSSASIGTFHDTNHHSTLELGSGGDDAAKSFISAEGSLTEVGIVTGMIPPPSGGYGGGDAFDDPEADPDYVPSIIIASGHRTGCVHMYELQLVLNSTGTLQVQSIQPLLLGGGSSSSVLGSVADASSSQQPQYDTHPFDSDNGGMTLDEYMLLPAHIMERKPAAIQQAEVIPQSRKSRRKQKHNKHNSNKEGANTAPTTPAPKVRPRKQLPVAAVQQSGTLTTVIKDLDTYSAKHLYSALYSSLPVCDLLPSCAGRHLAICHAKCSIIIHSMINHTALLELNFDRPVRSVTVVPQVISHRPQREVTTTAAAGIDRRGGGVLPDDSDIGSVMAERTSSSPAMIPPLGAANSKSARTENPTVVSPGTTETAAAAAATTTASSSSASNTNASAKPPSPSSSSSIIPGMLSRESSRSTAAQDSVVIGKLDPLTKQHKHSTSTSTVKVTSAAAIGTASNTKTKMKMKLSTMADSTATEGGIIFEDRGEGVLQPHTQLQHGKESGSSNGDVHGDDPFVLAIQDKDGVNYVDVLKDGGTIIGYVGFTPDEATTTLPTADHDRRHSNSNDNDGRIEESNGTNNNGLPEELRSVVANISWMRIFPSSLVASTGNIFPSSLVTTSLSPTTSTASSGSGNQCVDGSSSGIGIGSKPPSAGATAARLPPMKNRPSTTASKANNIASISPPPHSYELSGLLISDTSSNNNDGSSSLSPVQGRPPAITLFSHTIKKTPIPVSTKRNNNNLVRRKSFDAEDQNKTFGRKEAVLPSEAGTMAYSKSERVLPAQKIKPNNNQTKKPSRSDVGFSFSTEISIGGGNNNSSRAKNQEDNSRSHRSGAEQVSISKGTLFNQYHINMKKDGNGKRMEEEVLEVESAAVTDVLHGALDYIVMGGNFAINNDQYIPDPSKQQEQPSSSFPPVFTGTALVHMLRTAYVLPVRLSKDADLSGRDGGGGAVSTPQPSAYTVLDPKTAIVSESKARIIYAAVVDNGNDDNDDDDGRKDGPRKNGRLTHSVAATTTVTAGVVNRDIVYVGSPEQQSSKSELDHHFGTTVIFLLSDGTVSLVTF